MNKIFKKVLEYFKYYDPATKKIGAARTLLALSTLFTLLLNDFKLLFPIEHLEVINMNSGSIKVNFFLIFGITNLFATQLIAMVVLLFVISGYFIQITSILHFWVAASFFKLRPIDVGGDKTAMLLTLLLIPICLFDSRKNHWKKTSSANASHNIIKNSFFIIICLQIAFIYFDSVWDKLKIKEWRNGKVIYYWFTHDFYGMPKKIIEWVDPVLSNMFFLKTVTYSTLILELVIAFGILFSSRNRMVILKTGIIFHFLIMLIHGYASFFLVMCAALLLYLYPEPQKNTV